VTEFHEPLFVTVDPDTGEAAFDFTGHVQAEGLDLDAGETATPPDDRRVRWLREGASPEEVATLFGWRNGTGGQGGFGLETRVDGDSATLELAAVSFPHSINLIGFASVVAGFSSLTAHADGETAVILASDGSSDFARRAQEDVHLLGATGEPALQNGWVNFGSGFADAGFYLDTVGRVHLQGTIKSGTAALDTLLFTLPVGYRPAARVGPFPVASNLSYGEVDVHANGDVFLRVGHANYLALDSVSFRAA
jgi:hypothetical protein